MSDEAEPTEVPDGAAVFPEIPAELGVQPLLLAVLQATVFLAGSTEETPSRVANHKLPSASFQAAGWPSPLHSRMFMPSAVP